jgi:phospholipid/cholesterol/gamma-HCH transport system ATP-binding protein
MSIAPAGTPKIRIRGLTKHFGPKKVLDGIDLDIAAGTGLVVIGGSGTGKSVLIKSILGLVTPDAGVIEIDGENVLTASHSRARALRAQIGMLFQNGALFDSMSVWENVAFGLLAEKKTTRGQARGRAIDVLAQVGLDAAVAELSPAELSGGMQKRVALARAIAAEPAIIFFDEPTTGLDPIMGAVIDELIVDCVKRLGSTSIAITHDMASAQRIADNAAMLYNGKISWRGPASELLSTNDPVVDQFTHGRADGPIKMALRK